MRSLVRTFFIFNLFLPFLLFSKDIRSHSIHEVLASVSTNYITPIYEAIETVRQDKACDEILFTPLLGGGTKSKIFRVDIGNKKYVLRLLNESLPQERRKSELNAHKMGAKLKIAPEIIYADPSPIVIVMEFVEGRTLVKDDLNNVETVKKVTAALKKFHYYADQQQLVKQTKILAINELQTRYKKKGVVFPSCFDPLHKQLQNDFADLKREHLPSHGDFNPRNILITPQGNISIIDWAQTSVDHPFLDIAWLATFLTANNEQVKCLLTEYLEREASPVELQEALFFKNVTTFLVATLWIGRQEERNQEILDTLLNGPLKKGSEYINEGISVDEVLQMKGKALTLYSLGWLQEFIDNRSR